MKNIVIVDFGAGNLKSVYYKLRYFGYESIISNNPSIINRADILVICGAGHFGSAMDYLEKYKLIGIIDRKVIKEKTPIIGICLGMQLFGTFGEEGNKKGFGWIDGEVKSLPVDVNEKKPHIAWKKIKSIKKNIYLKNIEIDKLFYFIHSYHLICTDDSDVIATVDYGSYEIVSIVNQANIFGTQFHPEKSHKSGMAIITDFIDNQYT
jgi:imidazole glycerol-phosphate synthase subunit HisH